MTTSPTPVTPAIVLCPGQGAQSVGMARAWLESSQAAREVFAHADRQLGARLGGTLSDLCTNAPAEVLSRTDVSQPAIFTTSIACWRTLLAKRSMNDAEHPLAGAAGLSLGEYTALVIAGSVSFGDALELVTLRGRAMQDAAESHDAAAGGGGGMLALVGATDAQAHEICDAAREKDVLVCANFNAPGQVVLSGHKDALARAQKVAESMGLRAQMLQVAGAFHSPLMSPAADRLARALAGTPFTPPRCPVVSNVTAEPHDATDASPDTIRVRLVEQLTSPVRWSQSCAWKAQNLRGDFVELAPGRTLAGLFRRINRDVKVTSHDTP
ncbi:MAG: ACP S-malonyltransferase [Planctomycetota bacterium]|nr:ACP S-malonyltransferase [Planctomycetota bacterium]